MNRFRNRHGNGKVEAQNPNSKPSYNCTLIILFLDFIDPACSSRRFSTQFNLQDHIGRRHKSRAERPFKCDICQARFLISTDLMKHSRNHLPRAEFTLTCPQCPVLFARPNQLRLHLTIEHFVPKESKAERYRKYCEGKKIEAQKLGKRIHIYLFTFIHSIIHLFRIGRDVTS